jgi:hypothetical protein
LTEPLEPTAAGPPRKVSLQRRLAALLLSLAIACALGEVLVRAQIGSPLVEGTPLLRVRTHPTRGWEMLAGERHFTYHHPVEVNDLGLRGSALPAAKGEELRVLALGDSLTYGQGVGDDETLPHYLERALVEGDRRRRSWRVINGGLRGYATGQELALLRELGERIEPDAVVLFWYWNDLIEPPLDRVAADLARSGPICFDVGGPLEGRAQLVWRARQLLRRSALVMMLHDAWKTREHSFEGTMGRWTPAKGLERLAEHLDRFVALGVELGFRPLFAVIPESASIRGSHPSQAVAARAAELAAERGLGVIDLDEPLRALTEAAGEVPIIPFDGHYLPSANRAMAEVVAARLLADERAGGR